MKVLLKRLSLNSQTQKLEPPSRRLHHSLWERKSLQNMPFLLIAQWSYMVMDELLGHVVSPCITRKNRFTTVQYNASLSPKAKSNYHMAVSCFSCAKCCRLSLILGGYFFSLIFQEIF